MDSAVSPGHAPGDTFFGTPRGPKRFVGQLIYRNASSAVSASLRPHHPGGGRDHCGMSYRVISDLPPSVRNHPPGHAHMIGWAAVKRSYIKAGDIWIAR
jgi:hypothetical protein